VVPTDPWSILATGLQAVTELWQVSQLVLAVGMCLAGMPTAFA
jgi:hypothetical protein